MTTATVSKWGNSLAIRLPKEITTKFNLNNGKLLKLIPQKDSIELKVLPTKVQKHNKSDWSKYLIQTKSHKKQDISSNIDEFLYEKNN
jgi:antitoxin MazE